MVRSGKAARDVSRLRERIRKAHLPNAPAVQLRLTLVLFTSMYAARTSWKDFGRKLSPGEWGQTRIRLTEALQEFGILFASQQMLALERKLVSLPAPLCGIASLQGFLKGTGPMVLDE